MNHPHRPAPVLAALLCALVLSALAGCACNKTKPESVVRAEPPPPYPQAARAYSERIAPFDQLWGRSVVRLNYADEGGDRHTEQGEGVLQVRRPDHLALSIKKAGKMLFWLGCDPERYWWIDLINKNDAQVGRHEHISESGGAAKRAGGVVIRPLEVIRLLGIIPLDPGAAGTTQWSDDGRLLGLITDLDSGRQRIWVDPASYEARRIELFDRAGKLVLTAELDQYEPADVAGMGGNKPRIAGIITATHPATDTVLRLNLAGVKNQGVSDKAFAFEELARTLGVEHVTDLDAPDVPAPARNN